MELSCRLMEIAQTIEGAQQWPFKALAAALEVIPKTLAQNCGGDVVRILTELRAKHAVAGEGIYFGIDGNTGKFADMRDSNIWDPLAVKQQTFKTAIESSCMLLRIDDIVSGIKKERPNAMASRDNDDEAEGFGDQRDG